MAAMFVVLSALPLLISALPTAPRSVVVARSACMERVNHLSGSAIASDEAKLMDVCLNMYDLSESACGSAKEVLAGRKLEPELAPSVCSALIGPATPQSRHSSFRAVTLNEQAEVSEHEGAVASALVQRGKQGAERKVSAKLENSVKRKSGLPRSEDYLVKSAHPVDYPQIHYSSKGQVNNMPPPASVDQTIAMPPDANGNYWDTPADGWVDNKAPTKS